MGGWGFESPPFPRSGRASFFIFLVLHTQSEFQKVLLAERSITSWPEENFLASGESSLAKFLYKLACFEGLSNISCILATSQVTKTLQLSLSDFVSFAQTLTLILQDIGHDPQKAETRIYATKLAQPYHVDACDIVGKPQNPHSKTLTFLTLNLSGLPCGHLQHCGLALRPNSAVPIWFPNSIWFPNPRRLTTTLRRGRL